MPEGTFLSVHDAVPAEDARVVDQGLDDFNSAAASLHEVRPLACFARLEGGAVVGGAIGRTWGQCCELQRLWVHPAHQRAGLGTRLVRQFEETAAARGCSVFYLDTFSFQARPFYERLGYEARLEIRGFAPGVAKYIMVRR
jgi:GNAT superfamily N-acetyltransferase